jgi:membrane protease YdiL (CAAX protease family)
VTSDRKSASVHNGLQFFAGCYTWSWVFWGIVVGLQLDVWHWPNTVLLYLGGLGPTLAGLAMLYRVGGTQSLSDLVRRSITVRKHAGRWLVLSLFVPPAVGLLAAFIVWGFGSDAPPIDFQKLQSEAADALGLAVMLVFLLLLGPIPEEIGWRGFAQDALQSRLSALLASVTVGLGWGLWHWPLFLMPGYYEAFGGTPPEPGRFMIDIVATSVLIGYAYNATGGSLLAAILFHFANNATGEILALSPEAENVRSLLMIALGAIAALFMRGAVRSGER